MLELGLSTQRIYQDLVAGHGFGGSVSRYVAKLEASGAGWFVLGDHLVVRNFWKRSRS
jgi:hypothetical protein